MKGFFSLSEREAGGAVTWGGTFLARAQPQAGIALVYYYTELRRRTLPLVRRKMSTV